MTDDPRKLKVALQVVTSCMWWDLGEGKASEEKMEIISFGNKKELMSIAKVLYERTVQDFEKLMSYDSEQKWLQKVSKSGTITDRVTALSTLVQMCPALCLTHLKHVLTMAQKKNRTEATAGIDAFRELIARDLLPRAMQSRDLKLLHRQALGGRKTCSVYEALAWYFEDGLKTAIASFVQVLHDMCRDSVAFMRSKALKTTAELLRCGMKEQESTLLSLMVLKMGDQSDKRIASLAQLMLVSLTKFRKELYPKVLTEMGTVISRDIKGFNRKEKMDTAARVSARRSVYHAVAFLSDVPLPVSDVGVEAVAKLSDIYSSAIRGLMNCSQGGKMLADEQVLVTLRLALAGLQKAVLFMKKHGKLVRHPLTPDDIHRLLILIHTSPVETLKIGILVFIFRVGSVFGTLEPKHYRALYEQLSSYDFIQASTKVLLIDLIKTLVRQQEEGEGDAEEREIVLACIKRLLQAVCGVADPSITMKALECLTAMNELTGSPPGKMNLGDAVGDGAPPGTADQEEQSGEDKKEGPVGTVRFEEYVASGRDPRFVKAGQSMLWEAHALRHHFDPAVQEMVALGYTLEVDEKEDSKKPEEADKNQEEKAGSGFTCFLERLKHFADPAKHFKRIDRFVETFLKDEKIEKERTMKAQKREEREEGRDMDDPEGEVDKFFDGFLEGYFGGKGEGGMPNDECPKGLEAFLDGDEDGSEEGDEEAFREMDALAEDGELLSEISGDELSGEELSGGDSDEEGELDGMPGSKNDGFASYEDYQKMIEEDEMKSMPFRDSGNGGPQNEEEDAEEEEGMLVANEVEEEKEEAEEKEEIEEEKVKEVELKNKRKSNKMKKTTRPAKKSRK